MRGALGAVGRSVDRARSGGPSFGMAVVLLLAAATAGACSATGSPPGPVAYGNSSVMCEFQPLAAAPAYAGDVHPLVMPSFVEMQSNDRITLEQADMLAGQPVEQAQLVGCERTKWVEAGVGCAYSGAVSATKRIGRQMLTLWVAVLATGRVVASTTMTGPEPTENDCPGSITQGEAGEAGLLPGPWVALSDRKAWFLGFVHGAVRDLAPVPSALAVSLVSISINGGGHVSVVTTPGAKCTLSMTQTVPGATQRAENDIWDRDLGPHTYAGPDGTVEWSWDLDWMGLNWDPGAATVTVTCTLGDATASTSGQTTLGN